MTKDVRDPEDIRRRNTDGLNQEAIKVLEDNQLLQLYGEFSRGVRRYVNKMIRINQSGKPFTYANFPEMKKKAFKQRVFELRKLGFVETAFRHNCAYYRVMNFRLSPEWERIASKAMGVPVTEDPNRYKRQENCHRFLEEYLADLDELTIHNIRLQFNAYYLYERVQDLAREDDMIQFVPQNKFYILHPPFSWGKHRTIRIIITPKNLVQIIVKSTLEPLAFDEHGMYELMSMMGEVRLYLTYYGKDIPPPTEWMFESADFGQDSKRTVHKFQSLRFKDITGAMIQIYAKRWHDGKRRLRVEKNVNTHRLFNEIIEVAKNPVAKEEFKVKDLMPEDAPSLPPNQEESRQEAEELPLEHFKNADAQNQMGKPTEEAENVSNFDDYVPPKDGEVIGVILTGCELYENPDWKKFAGDPKHSMVYHEDNTS